MYKVKKVRLTLLITAIIVTLFCIFVVPRIIVVAAGPITMLLAVVTVIALGMLVYRILQYMFR